MSSDDLDTRQTPTKKLSAWEMRERAKQSRPSAPTPGVRRPIPKPKVDLDDDGVDPNLPPAFRAAFARQRKNRIDDFNSLASVHTTSSTMMTENTNASDSDDSSSFDGHDSFASIGEDGDDDEAYREGRNQMARQTLESTRSPRGHTGGATRANDFRLKKGVGGTPLDFIAE